MKVISVLCGIALLSGCIYKSSESKPRDVFLEDVLKSKHAVVYLDGADVFLVSCKTDTTGAKFPSAPLTRAQCNHLDKTSHVQFINTSFEKVFQVKLKQRLQISNEAPALLSDIEGELVYKKRKLDEARQLIVENAKAQVTTGSNDTGADAQLVTELTNRIEFLESEKSKFADFEAVVGSLRSGQTLSLLNDERRALLITKSF